jgi:hypothetical protein
MGLDVRRLTSLAGTVAMTQVRMGAGTLGGSNRRQTNAKPRAAVRPTCAFSREVRFHRRSNWSLGPSLLPRALALQDRQLDLLQSIFF